MMTSEEIIGTNDVAVTTPYLMMRTLRSIIDNVVVYTSHMSVQRQWWQWQWWLRYYDCVILCSHDTYITQYERMHSKADVIGIDEVDPHYRQNDADEDTDEEQQQYMHSQCNLFKVKSRNSFH